jgi:predicted metalloprotease
MCTAPRGVLIEGMRIRAGVPLDPGEVIDERGAGGPGLSPGLGCLPLALIGGGGGGAIVGLLLLLLLLFGAFSGGGASSSHVAGSNDLATQCTTGAAAAQNSDCQVVAVVDSVQSYWSTALPQQRHVQYAEAPTVLYTDELSTGCGTATTSIGPFYCPVDKRVYLDLSFFKDLQTQLGAQGGAFAQAYVIAHEYGHHVQDLLGTLDRVGNPTEGATGTSVRLELQADCYAGVWAHHAQDTKIIENVTPADIEDALNAAAAVGDDRIQRSENGKVKPDTFTHGTSAQRDRWFSAGDARGNMADCDTFAAPSL